MVLKTSLMGSLSGAKCCSALKTQSRFRERMENACFLKPGCPRFWLLVWVRVLSCEFIFFLSLLRLRECLIELSIAFSNWMYDCAQDKTSLIRATSCFNGCLYGVERPTICWWTRVQIYLHRSWILWQAVLEVADVRLEAVTLPYLDREEVVVVLLSLPARSILSDERLGYLLEVLERMWWQRVELIWSHTFQAGQKG